MEQRNAQERERRRSDPKWVEKVNSRRRVENLPPEQREKERQRSREKWERLAAERPPKLNPKPLTTAGMAEVIRTSLKLGGWDWVERDDMCAGSGRSRTQPPMFAFHSETERIVWIEVRSSAPSKPPKRNASWRAYLADQDCEIRIVHQANLFDVCAELDPSLAAFT